MALRWPAHEYELLHRLYPGGGSRAVHRALPHRAMGTIKVIAHKRGIRCTLRRRWSPEESAIVVQHYPSLGIKLTARLLAGREPHQVATHAFKNGVRRRESRQRAMEIT